MPLLYSWIFPLGHSLDYVGFFMDINEASVLLVYKYFLVEIIIWHHLCLFIQFNYPLGVSLSAMLDVLWKIMVLMGGWVIIFSCDNRFLFTVTFYIRVGL